jgi:hypothetical protein
MIPCYPVADLLDSTQLNTHLTRKLTTHRHVDRREAAMGYKGYTQGNVIILKEPLPVPNGTEVEISIPQNKGKRRTGRKKSRVVSETFGLIPADVATVRAVLEEDLYAT